MMGQIFEQLLAEINSDTEEVVDKRSEKGAFTHPGILLTKFALSHWLRILKVTLMIKILLENSIY